MSDLEVVRLLAQFVRTTGLSKPPPISDRDSSAGLSGQFDPGGHWRSHEDWRQCQ